VGPLNLPASLPYHASEMYSRNLFNLLKPALAKGDLAIRLERRSVRGLRGHPRRPDQARKRHAKSRGQNMIDGVIALYIFMLARVHRLRGHFPGAGHPAHAAHVRIELRACIVLVARWLL